MSTSKLMRAISAATGVATLAAMAAVLVGPIGGATAAPARPTLADQVRQPRPGGREDGPGLHDRARTGAGGTADAENVVVTDNLPNG